MISRPRQAHDIVHVSAPIKAQPADPAASHVNTTPFSERRVNTTPFSERRHDANGSPGRGVTRRKYLPSPKKMLYDCPLSMQPLARVGLQPLIFNPVIQGKKFDPNGDYVRCWCPNWLRFRTYSFVRRSKSCGRP